MDPILYAIGLAKNPSLTMFEARQLIQLFIYKFTGQLLPVVSVEMSDITKFERMVTISSSFFNLLEEDLVTKGILHIEEL